MIPRFRFVVATTFIVSLLFVPLFATDQLKCPSVSRSPKDDVTICAVRQEKDGPIFKGHVRIKIDYRDFTLWSDESVYNSDTGDVTLTGHVALDGGPNDEHIKASHGTYNVRSETGRFYDVVGTISSHQRPHQFLLRSPNPFAFTGKVVEKTSPDHYVVHDGIITTCDLPNPKWQFNARRASVTAGDSATLFWSSFRIRGLPVFYFPFATHPVEQSGRKSGLLLPNIGNSSIKGTILGEGFYWAINRSMDARMGAEYFSRRGWAQHGEFRFRAGARSYLDLTYFGVMDRGIGTPKVNQGGENARLRGEDHFGRNIRGFVDVDYLSSFLFRLAFNEVFTQPVYSEVKSQGFLSQTTHGFSSNALIQRYQNFESVTPGDVITILHAPSFDFSGVDQRLGRSPFFWSFETAIGGLSRREPSFQTAPLVGRFDAAPSISLPLVLGGWSLRPEVGIEYTFYTQQLALSTGAGLASNDPINRKALEGSIEVRPPALERVFGDGSRHRRVKHVIEPRAVYRRVTGIEDFSKILRFDARDIRSNTNEFEYAVVNRLYIKQRSTKVDDCVAGGSGPSSKDSISPHASSPPWEEQEPQELKRPNCPIGPPAREVVNWELAQKYFLDTNFGGALVSGGRNIFTSSIDLSGFEFLTRPRHLSPLVSRLRIQPTPSISAEWNADYDFQSGHVNGNTMLLNFHVNKVSFGGGDSYVYFPGSALVSNQLVGPQRFHQYRMQLQYGDSNKRGLSGASNFGVDANSGVLQSLVLQMTYNWNCCGVNLEYRRIAIGSVRNENQYRFSYSLANIGSFGNLLKKERLY
jgi:LPS-assembly protein